MSWRLHHLDAVVRDAESSNLRAIAEELFSRRLFKDNFVANAFAIRPGTGSCRHFMLEGIANKVIARRLSVSTRTVEYRRQNIFKKTATESLAELIQLVLEVGDATDS